MTNIITKFEAALERRLTNGELGYIQRYNPLSLGPLKNGFLSVGIVQNCIQRPLTSWEEDQIRNTKGDVNSDEFDDPDSINKRLSVSLRQYWSYLQKYRKRIRKACQIESKKKGCPLSINEEQLCILHNLKKPKKLKEAKEKKIKAVSTAIKRKSKKQTVKKN